MVVHFQTTEVGHDMHRKGQLLISHPNLKVTNPFNRTVIYIYQDHPQQGTAGLVLNRPGSVTVKEMARESHTMYPDGHTLVHQGGPINPQAITILHSDEWQSTNTVSAGNGLAISSDELMLEKISTGNCPIYWRTFSGMCGWQPGQLEAELKGTFPYVKEQSWLTVQGDCATLFDSDGDEQWQHCLKLSGQKMFDAYF